MIKKLFIALVKWYQKRISPMTPPSCRYRPSCSNYMIMAIEKHGLKGVLMGIARMIRSQIILHFDAIKIFKEKKRKAKAFLFSIFNILTMFLE